MMLPTTDIFIKIPTNNELNGKNKFSFYFLFTKINNFLQVYFYAKLTLAVNINKKYTYNLLNFNTYVPS